MSSKLDEKLHTHVSRTNPDTLEKETMSVEEFRKVMLNPSSILNEWQRWLDRWRYAYQTMYDITDERVEQTEMLPDSMYEYGPESSVDMTEVLQKSIYKNHVAMYECQVLNYFHWHTGIFKVDVKFEELRGHKDFNRCCIIQPEQYDEYLNLDIDKHRNARAIFELSFNRYMENHNNELKPLDMPEPVPLKKDYAFELLDKMWFGTEKTITFTDEKGEEKERIIQQKYEPTELEIEKYESKYMKVYRSQWLRGHIVNQPHYQTPEQLYESFIGQLENRRVIPKKRLYSFMGGNPNSFINDLFCNSFERWFARSLSKYELISQPLGTRGALKDCYALVERDYKQSDADLPDEFYYLPKDIT